MGAKREASTSITHLVKTVAKETILDMLDSGELIDAATIEDDVKKLGLRLIQVERELCIKETPVVTPEPAPSNFATPNSGLRWTHEQEQALKSDFAKAISWLAYRQGRSRISVHARLKQLGYFYCEV